MDRDALTYLRWLFFFIVVLLAGLAGLNMFMNPYGHFDSPRINGINKLSLGFNHRAALTKALAISRVQPETIILGNSRAETAYDPEHPGFTWRPAYNLALGGAGLREMRRYFLETLAQGRVRHLLLALDLTMLDPAAIDVNTVPEDVLLTDSSGRSLGNVRQWRRLASLLLSSTATSDSVWTLTHQHKPVASYFPSGQRNESADTEQVVREGGPRKASRGIESNFLASSLQSISAGDFSAYNALMTQLLEMFSLAAKDNIRITLITNPIHAREVYLFAAAGLWPEYEKWKHDLVALVAKSPRPDLIDLWDFSGVSTCTAEAMPPEGNAEARMHWYRESSHFQKILGDIVLDKALLGKESATCPGLGRRLAPDTIEALLAEQRSALKQWVAANSVDAAEIDGMARARGRHPTTLFAPGAVR